MDTTSNGVRVSPFSKVWLSYHSAASPSSWIPWVTSGAVPQLSRTKTCSTLSPALYCPNSWKRGSTLRQGPVQSAGSSDVMLSPQPAVAMAMASTGHAMRSLELIGTPPPRDTRIPYAIGAGGTSASCREGLTRGGA